MFANPQSNSFHIFKGSSLFTVCSLFDFLRIWHENSTLIWSFQMSFSRLYLDFTDIQKNRFTGTSTARRQGLYPPFNFI